MSSSLRTKFYRDKQNGKIAGVCSGLADYTGVETVWVRVAMFLSIFMTGGWTIPIYIAIAMFSQKKPAELYVDDREQRFWQGVRQSPARTARDVKSRFRELDRRLADVELFYTSKNTRLSDEIEKLR